MHRSRLTDFYLGRMPDGRGRYIEELQSATLSDLEAVHDYIQWLFPLPTRSGANPLAPTLSPMDISTFKANEELRRNLLESLKTMLRFYGLELAPNGVVLRANDFASRSAVWLTQNNHNYLRITRILRSLTLLGCADAARSLLACLRQIYADNSDTIGHSTLHQYWATAVR